MKFGELGEWVNPKGYRQPRHSAHHGRTRIDSVEPVSGLKRT